MKIVFVHIGENPSSTLIQAANIAKGAFSDADLILITDRAHEYKSFPGQCIQYDSVLVSQYLNSFIKRNKELRKLAGGYWLNTIVRIFALYQAAQINLDEELLHLESDVYLYASRTDFAAHSFSKLKVSYPRLDSSRGIASIFYSPNAEVLKKFLDEFALIINANKVTKNDMDYLGVLLNKGVAVELPSHPGKLINKNGENLIFDGAALGQYLLGVDPIHTNGRVISGYQNSGYPYDISTFRWSVTESGKLKFEFENIEYQLANLHAHSKEVLEPPSRNSTRWSQIISEANLELPRTHIARDANGFHLKLPSTLDRLRIARKKGLVKQLSRYLKQRMRNIGN